MIAARDVLTRPGQEDFAEAGAENVVGSRVITDSGNELGEVTDLVLAVDQTEARVVGYEIGGPTVERGPGADRRYIPLPETFAVSRAALIVPASVTNFVRDDLSGFGGAVDEFRAQLERQQ
jgi:sporulation protein YlmC with PRC-barrel domain